eukprot:m.745202 g.745202  ORF g.745202 m.745202 type:complete len:411 (+) comp23127_c3_seq3:128-1360(+)
MSASPLSVESVPLPPTIRTCVGVNEKLWDEVQQDNSRCLHTLACNLYNFILDEYSTVILIARLLWTIETLFVSLIAIGSPIFFYYFRSDGDAVVYPLSWTVVSFAVVFPLTMSLNGAFARREKGLEELAKLKTNILSIYFAHRFWDWTDGSDVTKGRQARLRPKHADDARRVLLRLMRLIRLQLEAPIVSRARHHLTKSGRSHQERVLSRVHEVKTAIATHLQLIQLLCEEMKFAGLPGNEASRMRNNFSSMVQAYESLTMLKHYRTPLGLRVFARGYIAVTPIMFGPYYAAIAGVDTVDSNDTIGVGLAFTCVLSALTTLSMQGLFNIRLQLEDPFASGTSFDAIDISIETQSLLDKLVEDSADVPSTQDIIDGNATRLAQAVRKCTAATFLPNDTAEITGAADQWTTV